MQRTHQTVNRHFRSFELVKQMDERDFKWIVVGLALGIGSRVLIELDLDVDGIPSMVNQCSIFILMSSLLVASYHIFAKRCEALKLKKEIDAYLRGPTTIREEKINTDPKSQEISRAAKFRQGQGARKPKEAISYKTRVTNWLLNAKTWCSKKEKPLASMVDINKFPDEKSTNDTQTTPLGKESTEKSRQTLRVKKPNTAKSKNVMQIQPSKKSLIRSEVNEVSTLKPTVSGTSNIFT